VTQNLIIETTNGIYEVRRSAKRFRRIHGCNPSECEFPVGLWFPFQRMTEPEIGEPVRFFWVIAQSERRSRIGICETSPVVRVLDDPDAGDQTPPAEEPARRLTPRR
jgi:hypothetical protein